MRVALTGASGFVGRHLATQLLAAGQQVVCLARAEARGAPLRDLGCDVVLGDLQDDGALARLVTDADAVFHLAGRTSARSESEFLHVNGIGTGNVARAARRAGARRLVYVSSLSATGPAARGEVVTEATPPHPLTPYGRSKLAGEDSVRASGVPFTIIRPPAVYGPHDREFLRLFRLASIGLTPLLGDGEQQLSLIHVDDLARALVATSRAEVAAGRLYHACHPEIITQRELAAAVGRALGRRPRMLAVPVPIAHALLRMLGAAARFAGGSSLLSADKAPEFLAAAWTCSSDAISRDTGWRAEIALGRGLAETAAWYRREGWI